MISRSHKTVFVHVPKAAGQSVEQAFLNDLGLTWEARAPLLLRPNGDSAKGPPRLAHLAALDYVARGHMSAQEWEAFYRFAVVRDPFARAVSLYRHLGPDVGFSAWVTGWLSETLAAAPDISARWFVRSQVEYLCDDAGETLLVQDVLRFERLREDFARAAKASGLKSDHLPRRNTTGDKPQPDIEGKPSAMTRFGRSLRSRLGASRFERFDDWRDYLDDASVARLRQLYARDFAFFDYSDGDPRGTLAVL